MSTATEQLEVELRREVGEALERYIEQNAGRQTDTQWGTMPEGVSLTLEDFAGWLITWEVAVHRHPDGPYLWIESAEATP